SDVGCLGEGDGRVEVLLGERHRDRLALDRVVEEAACESGVKRFPGAVVSPRRSRTLLSYSKCVRRRIGDGPTSGVTQVRLGGMPGGMSWLGSFDGPGSRGLGPFRPPVPAL